MSYTIVESKSENSNHPFGVRLQVFKDGTVTNKLSLDFGTRENKNAWTKLISDLKYKQRKSVTTPKSSIANELEQNRP